MNKYTKRIIVSLILFFMLFPCFANDNKISIKGNLIFYANIVFNDYVKIKQKDEDINDYLFDFEITDNTIIVVVYFKKEIKKKGGGAQYILDINGCILEKQLFK